MSRNYSSIVSASSALTAALLLLAIPASGQSWFFNWDGTTDMTCVPTIEGNNAFFQGAAAGSPLFDIDDGTVPVFSADYYVAANGNDSNPGTILLPFATIEKARQAVRGNIASGMTHDILVAIRGGTYYISNTVAFAGNDSGTNGHRVFYRNYPDEVPVIDGGVPITGWTETSPGSGIYQANANNLNFRQLYINNQRGIRARWPNVDAADSFFVATGGFMKYVAPIVPPANPPTTTTTSHYKIPKSTIADWASLNRVEIVTTRAFQQVRTRISSYTTDATYAYVYGMSPDSMGQSDQSEGSYFFENAYEFIDAPGEWYLDTDTSIVYYKPLAGENMSTALVVAPRVEQMISIIDAQNITFYGLTFQHSTWLLPSSEGLYHRQAGMRNYNGLPANPGAIYLKSTGNIVFERNIIRHMGANGMTLDRGVHDTMINGNVFYEIADTAINHAINWNVYSWTIGGVKYTNLGPNNTDPNFQVRNDTIKNNYIYKMGVDYSAGGGIWSYYSIGLKILNNEIRDVPNIGINVGWGANLAPVPAYKDVEIKYNKIHNTCKQSNDSGGIHTKSNPENAHIYENWIYNIQKFPAYETGSDWPFCGIYLDDGSDFFTVENNVVEDVGDHQWYPGDTSGIGGLNIKVRNGGIGINNTFINNAAQKVGPHPVTGAITVMQWPEFPEWGSPIDPDTAQRVKEKAGIEPAYIIVIGCPAITLSPATLPDGALGVGYTQTVTAIGGVTPYAFTVTSGSLPKGLVLATNGAFAGLPLALGTNTFTVTATDANGCMGSTNYTLAITPSGSELDVNKPIVMIALPKNKATATAASISVSGTARDAIGTPNTGVALVLYSVNGGAQQLAATANQFMNWTANVTLIPGWNTVTAQSVDYRGNISDLLTNSYFLRVVSPLTLLTRGEGGVSMTSGTNLVLTSSYTITATPGQNWLFSNWLASVDGGPTGVVSSLPKYPFQMQNNLTLIANFVTNTFIGAAGNYYGLFWDTNGGVAHPSAGFFTLKTDSKQKFSGNLYVDGDKVSFAGLLGLDGTGTNMMKAGKENRNKYGKSPVYVTVAVDLNGNDIVTGTVTNVDWVTNEVWTSTLTGNRAVLNLTDNPATNYAGSYTLVIPGTNAAGSPKGDSYAVVTVASNGTVAASGGLAEGAGSKALKLKPLAASISKDGEWPFYAPTYLEARIVAGKTIKEYQGALLGWLAFTGDPYATNRDLRGTVVWMKPGWTNTFYTGGFTNALAVVGSAYVMPADGVRALTVPNHTATAGHTDGNLTADFENQFAWLAVLKKSNKLTGINPLYEEKTLAVTAKSGLVKGTFLHPDNANLKTAVTGVLLQDDNVGRGFFLGTSESGAMTLTPD